MNEPFKTPLIDLLRRIPESHLIEWETQWFEDGTPCGHGMADIGHLCHRAANEIEALAANGNEG